MLRYDATTGDFFWRITPSRNTRIGQRAGRVHYKYGYIQISIRGKRYQAHRLAWLYCHGKWPVGQIDHINRIRDDNRIANLRPATRSQNQANRSLQANNTSGFKGVVFHKQIGKWVARIGKQHIGTFDSAYDAATAYAATATRLYGEYGIAS